MRSDRVIRCVVTFAASLWAALVCAHDLITADALESYVERAQTYVSVIKNEKSSAVQRATHQLDLALMQDEIKELLNRDLAMHGKVQGLPSNALIERFRAAGAPLPWSTKLGRFAAPLERYEAYVQDAQAGPRLNEALFGALSGYFYESFREDPLDPISVDGKALGVHIARVEQFMKSFPQDKNLEETRFIAAILHLRAARSGANAQQSGARAKELLHAFRRDYPDSMRAAAVPVLLEAIPK